MNTFNFYICLLFDPICSCLMSCACVAHRNLQTVTRSSVYSLPSNLASEEGIGSCKRIYQYFGYVHWYMSSNNSPKKIITVHGKRKFVCFVLLFMETFQSLFAKMERPNVFVILKTIHVQIKRKFYLSLVIQNKFNISINQL